MNETSDYFGKCGAEIDPPRRVDFTLKTERGYASLPSQKEAQRRDRKRRVLISGIVEDKNS